MKMRMKRSSIDWVLLIIVVVLSIACTDKRKVDVLSTTKLEAVLRDYHLAQVIIGDLPSNQRYKKDLYFKYVYDKHGVTKAEIDSSLVYYARHPEGLAEVYANLSKRVEDDIKRLADEDTPLNVRSSFPVIGDSANLWYDVNCVELSSSPLKGNRYAFTVPTDTNFKRLDTIVWGGEVLFISAKVDSLHRYLHLNLKVTYLNDSIVSADTLLYTSGRFSLVVCDSAVVKSIDGTAYLKSTEASDRLLVLSPTLMRYRNKGATLVVSDSAMIEKQMKVVENNKRLKIADFQQITP